MARLTPGIDRPAPRTVGFSCEDYPTAYRLLTAVVVLGTAAFDGAL
jgi:D-aminopeptidase